VRRFLKKSLAIIGLLVAAATISHAEEKMTPERMVKLFDDAANRSADLNELKRFGVSRGFNILSEERDDGVLSFLEMQHRDGVTFLVGHRKEYADFSTDMISLFLTRYESDQTFHQHLKTASQRALPSGPRQKVDLAGGFSDAIGWQADYPGILYLQVKYHSGESASMIEATLVRMK
jgi:hypothetical protein